MAHITYWSADKGACGHYRCELPAEALRELGHTVVVDRTLQADCPNYTDVIIGQRVGEPLPSRVWRALARVEGRNFRMVYELDDDVFSLPYEKHNPAAREWPSRLANVVKNIQCADAVTVTTAALAEAVYFSAAPTCPIHVVPNAVPQSLLDLGDTAHERDDGRVFGWSGSDTHDGDWSYDAAAREVMNWFARPVSPALDPWSLRTIGRPAGPLLRAKERRPSARWEHVGGTDVIDEYYRLLADLFDVGLAPLAPTTFNRSKSDLRLLELAALGIPWIASDAGPYAASGMAQGGVWVTRPGGWRDGLTLLSADADLRKRLGEEGRAWAESRTVAEILPFWLEAYGLPSGTVPSRN